MFIINHYKAYLERMDNNTVRSGIETMYSIAQNSSVAFVQHSAKGAIAGLLATYEGREKDAAGKEEELKAAQEMTAFIKAKLDELN